MWGENGVEGWTAMGRKRVVMVCYDTTRDFWQFGVPRVRIPIWGFLSTKGKLLIAKPGAMRARLASSCAN